MTHTLCPDLLTFCLTLLQVPQTAWLQNV